MRFVLIKKTRFKRFKKLSKNLRKVFFNYKTALSLVFLLLLVYFLYGIFYANKIIPNVYFGDVSLSGKDKAEAMAVISKSIDSYEGQTLYLSVENGEKIGIKTSDLGLNFNKDAIFQEAFYRGRSGDVLGDVWIRLRAPFVRTIVNPVYSLNFLKLTSFLDGSLSKYDQKASDASITFKGGQAEILPDKKGLVVDRSKLISDTRDDIDNLSIKPIKISQIESSSIVDAEGAKKALEKVGILTNQSIVLSFDRDTWDLSGEKLFDLLTFKPYGFEGNDYFYKLQFGDESIFLKQISLDSPKTELLDVSLDDGKLDQFVNEIANYLDKPKVDATLKFEGGRVVEFTPAQDGQMLDTEKTKNLILDKISIGNPNVEKDVSITLPVSVSKAEIANEKINSLGIKELIGRGISYFGGSIQNRIDNLTLGSSRISGALVAPGETFSFNKTVGEVSGATGYKPAYVISEGRTVLDDGGGICQVSTTLFRAVLNSGLPIIVRTAHAYRVGYYEENGFKPGLDATVWAPTVDFQFKNDTDHHILVQAVVDPALAKLQIDIYGTSDGRKVELSTPVISNQSPPPPDKYQDDPTLPKGVTKQVDFSAWGANVVFARKVFKNGQTIIDETFTSNYRPWQAIFLVGTGA